MDRSVFLDLACENSDEKFSASERKSVWTAPSGNFRICRGKNDQHGGYSVFFTDPIWLWGEELFFEVREKLSDELSRFLSVAFEKDCSREKILLVAGLGNPKMTADALGAEVIERMEITRKIGSDSESSVKVCAVIPGVLGATGIETVEHIGALCDRIHPSAVLAVDALSAKSQARLGATIQISSGGISPGGGIGNLQKRLSEETLGVPVVSIGVPTVVRSSVIVREALEELRISLTEEEIGFISRNPFFMLPGECDLLLQSAALLLASAIHRACEIF